MFRGWLKQSTAITVNFGPFVSSSDGDTEYTTAISAASVTISKASGAFNSKSDATATSHRDGGVHLLTLNATDTNTLGKLEAQAHPATALVVTDWWEVTETGYPTVDTQYVNGATAETSSDFADAMLDADRTAHTTSDSVGEAMQANYWVDGLSWIDGDPEEYRNVRWMKNDTPITSGVTSPTIRVIDADDGTNLIGSTAMSEAGSSHLFKYDATGAELTVSGTAYRVVLTATIDGATRTHEQSITIN